MNDIAIQNKLQRFVRDAMPDGWLCFANELLEAAEVLWKHSDENLRIEVTSGLSQAPEVKKIFTVRRTYLLLAGFAMENLLKGLLVAASAEHITSGKLSAELKSHKLLELGELVPDLSLTSDERAFCKLAQEAIPYWGRYPIPLEANGVLPETAMTIQRRDTFIGLHQRLGQKLHDQIMNGWDSGVGPRIRKMRAKKYGSEIDPSESLL